MGCGDVCLLNDEGFRAIEGSSRPPLINLTVPFRQTEKRRRHATSSYRDLPKHYVRKIGWLPVLRKYATARAEGPRYFTLCAKEAIDVRYFRQCGVLPFNPKERSYPTVTFVEREAQDYASIAEMLGQTRLGLLGDLEAIVLRPADFRMNTEGC